MKSRVKYFDAKKNEMIYVKERATPNFWNRLWNHAIDKSSRNKKGGGRGRYSDVVRITKKYLRPDEGPILEGGCGLGDKVISLVQNGYDCIGVDYAKKAVEYANKTHPEIKIKYGNVEQLDFEDEYFAGYWSLGVIEHFWDGYQSIAKEMFRVIRPGGYLFLSFPYMNFFRKIKAQIGLYGSVSHHVDNKTFYQFALNMTRVIKDYQSLGFSLIKKYNKSVLFGLKDEIRCLESFIDFIAKHKGHNFLTKAGYYSIDNSLNYLVGSFFGHTILLVFKK